MQPAKYTFGTRGLDLLADVQASFESQGFTTSVSVENFKGQSCSDEVFFSAVCNQIEGETI